MKALQSLTELFKAHITDAKNFTIWAENGAMFSAQSEDVDGFDIEYTAVIDMQDVAIQPHILFMHLVIWLSQYDPDRLSKGLPFPTFASQLLDGGKCDIRLKVDLREEFLLKESEQGNWKLGDIRYGCESDFVSIGNVDDLNDLVHFIGYQDDLPC